MAHETPTTRSGAVRAQEMIDANKEIVAFKWYTRKGAVRAEGQ